MSTTTSEDGVLNTQPGTNEAVNDDGAMAIVNDDNGTPTMVPLAEATSAEAPEETSTEQPSGEAVVEEPTAQATETDAEIVEWAKKKGLEINPENPNEVKLAKLQLENDRRFHATQQQLKQSPPPPEAMPEVEDPILNEVVQRQNANELRIYVRDWFEANPDMKANREELMQIANERPWLQDLDDVRAHFLASPERLTRVQQDGGRKALENLAQKQAAVPPKAGASDPSVYGSGNVITKDNVNQLIEKNDQAWFEKNYDTIKNLI